MESLTELIRGISVVLTLQEQGFSPLDYLMQSQGWDRVQCLAHTGMGIPTASHNIPHVQGVQKGPGLGLWFHLRNHTVLHPHHRTMATNAPAILGGQFVFVAYMLLLLR